MRLIVNPHKIEIIKDEFVNEREIDISKCTFEFAEEITQEYVKEAYFTYNGETYKQVINNNECAFPSEVLEQKGMVEIGVVAYLVENEQEIKRYNPSPAYFNTLQGSLKDAENSEPITPSEMEQFEQQLQNGLNSIDDKLDEVDTKMETVDTKIDEIDTAIEETNNLDLDVNKQDNKTTVTLTKKNGSTKSVDVLDGTDGQDGTSLEFMWQGTSLGIKTDDMQDYVFVDLQGVQGPIGETGEPFTIKKTYSSIAEMNADFDNMELGDYVMIASSVEIEDNAKLFTKGESAWIFITDFSGAMGIRGETGLTPNIQIGTVATGETSSVTRTGTNENPILNFVLEKGEKGNTGSTGPRGETGNGIASVVKTSTSGLTDTYTITYTNGNTSTFTVTNGKGISSIVKTSTSGLVDTYTVTFNDNTTMTYTVTNGKDGEDGEVTTNQLNNAMNYLKTIMNALPKVEGEGTDITLDNTADSPLSLGFKASESTQNSTTGKNLLLNEATSQTINGITFTINSDKTIKVNGTATEQAQITVGTVDLIANTTYILTGTPNGLNNNAFLSILGYGNDFGTGVSYTPSQNETKTIILRVLNGTNMSDKVFKPMVRLSTVIDDTYEPYTNGASPNPDYPQDIHVIKGDNEVVIENKNLFDYLDTEQVYPYTLSCANVKPNTTYYIKAYNITGSYTGTHALYTKINNEWVFNSSRVLINGFSFTTPENCTKIGLNGLSDPNKEVCQIELGTQATPYTPHKEQRYSLSLNGGNLFDKNNNVISGYYLYDNKTIGSQSDSRVNYIAIIPCLSNKKYIIEKLETNTFRVGYSSSYKTSGSIDYIINESNTSSVEITTNNNAKYIYLQIVVTSDYDSRHHTLEEILNSIQVKEESIELCNINNYADEFFKNVPECEYYDNTLEEGKWYKYAKIGKVVLDGSESWQLMETNTDTYRFVIHNVFGSNLPLNIDVNNFMCNEFQKVIGNTVIGRIDTEAIAIRDDKNGITIRALISRVNNLAGFKNWLQSHNIIIDYVLATPTKTLLSNTLQEQLDNISYAMAYQDQTNISQVNEDRPFVISAKTIKDMKTLEDRITALEESISL